MATLDINKLIGIECQLVSRTKDELQVKAFLPRFSDTNDDFFESRDPPIFKCWRRSKFGTCHTMKLYKCVGCRLNYNAKEHPDFNGFIVGSFNDSDMDVTVKFKLNTDDKELEEDIKVDESKPRPCKIIIDSDSRFEEPSEVTKAMWETLPYDQYGWNRLNAEYIDGVVYYKGSKVLDLKDIERCYNGFKHFDINELKSDESKNDDDDSSEVVELSSFYNKSYDYDWYYTFVSSTRLAPENIFDLGTKPLENTVLYFDGQPMTDAHIHFEIVDREY